MSTSSIKIHLISVYIIYKSINEHHKTIFLLVTQLQSNVMLQYLLDSHAIARNLTQLLQLHGSL